MAQRLFKNEEYREVLSSDPILTALIRSNYKEHYECAAGMQEFISEAYGKKIRKDEVITITLHLIKITSKENNL